jgi:hypothetical protein
MEVSLSSFRPSASKGLAIDYGQEPSCWYSDPEPTMPVAKHRGSS